MRPSLAACAAIAVIPTIAATLPARAQTQPAPAVAAGQIERGAYDRAERQLASALRVEPAQPEALLNLAVVYARTGRAAAARDLYRRVLDQPDVLMDLANGNSAGSHRIAQAGLAHLARTSSDAAR